MWGEWCTVSAVIVPLLFFAIFLRHFAIFSGWDRYFIAFVTFGVLCVPCFVMCIKRITMFLGIRRLNTFGQSDAPRVQVIGPYDCLARYGTWQDVAFEPEEFLGSFSVIPPKSRLICAIIIGACGLLVFNIAWGTFIIPDLGLVRRITGSTIVFNSMTCLASGLVTPIYLRLTPGRLEIVSSGFLRSQSTIWKSYDLRQASITIDFWNSIVHICAAGQTLELSLRMIWNRKRFAYYLVLAALSTYEIPDRRSEAAIGGRHISVL